MSNKTNLRALRQGYHIYLSELAVSSGLSTQYVSRAELGQIPATPRLERQLGAAIEEIIAVRKNSALALEQAHLACKGRLLQLREETPYEL